MSAQRQLGTHWLTDTLVDDFDVKLDITVKKTVQAAFQMEVDNIKEACKLAFKAGAEGKDFDFGQYFKEIY